MRTLLLACGALAREVIAIREKNGWEADIQALPSLLHNTPHHIPDAIRRIVERHRLDYEQIIIVYGDCGTGGTLDTMLDELGIERVSGPHCYEMYAGAAGFDNLTEEEPGTFYLTDYLAQSFDHLVVEGLGLDRYPELRDLYFVNYRRIVYLQQQHDPHLVEKAQAASVALDLPLEIRYTGYGELEMRLAALIANPVTAPGD